LRDVLEVEGPQLYSFSSITVLASMPKEDLMAMPSK
jgi:hypothetical protein